MKKKQRKKTNWSSIVLIAIVLVGLTVVVLANKKSEDKIIWEKISLQMIYPDKTATNDLVGDTLGRMNSFSTLLKGMAADRDTNLIRLLDSERAVAVSVEQLDADLKKLAGVRIDVIGQIHESMMGTESEKLLVKDIQGSIKKMVFDSYDVMWSEDFNDGLLINDSNCCELLFAEGRESDLPAMKMVNDIRLVTEQVQRSTPYHASYQFIFDKRSKIEVRGADYHRVKAIQQHLMTYELPKHIRGQIPIEFTAQQKMWITEVLADTRNVYILRNIALNADRNKRNVLVIGTAHINHIAYLMARYGVQSTFILPKGH